ncbi:FadR/GntR family transcriptional regulator [Kitasatospora saccharophila]|uniref:FadR/GntR family transcriptional regulator n=1 Tax=Kitasatospora saccharophila TaxID=407973 RepID=A0ABP5HV76_9ACTN
MTTAAGSRFGNGPRSRANPPTWAFRAGPGPAKPSVVDQIKGYILQSRLGPGDALPSENELCEIFGAGRSSVREAVKVLDALDIVQVRHGHGTFVGRLSLSALVESLSFRGLLSPDDDFRVLSDLVDVRELFERAMAARIIDALLPVHLEQLAELVGEMELRLQLGRDIVAADRSFHALLLQPLANELVAQLSSACWEVHAVVAPHLNIVTAQDEADTVEAHRAMVEALRIGDARRFTEAVRRHYVPVRRRIAAARAEAVANRA